MSGVATVLQKLKSRWWLGILIVVVGGGYYYFFVRNVSETSVATYAVVESVSLGTVSSGIETTGTIMAAQKLDLDVYKQARRIEAVYVSNASHIEAGTTLFSFDKSGAYVEVESARVGITEAELALANEQANYSDANTTLRTLESSVTTLRANIVQAEKDLVQARRDFFNANISVEPAGNATADKNRPAITGVYNGTTEGTYRIEAYRSSSEYGYSYRVSGLEIGAENIFRDIATPLGTQGLKIIFPTDVKHGDIWTVKVPNTAAAEYPENKENYTSKVLDLRVLMASKKTELANTELEIKNQSQTDNVPYRDLGVAKAAASLAKAKQQLSENYDVVKEQDIVAPFAGTVEGLANVVVGATPTGDVNDTISLGTLISDAFLVTFSLSAVDVAKVTVGQTVLVNITSAPTQAPLEAHITEISSLPESESVAQYRVQALIATTSSSVIKLREGLLADIEVVEKEVTDVIRVPLSALSYQNGQPTVRLVSDLTVEQEAELAKLGVIKSANGTFPSYSIPVEVGISGAFYVEIKSGLTVGQRIIVTNTETDTSVIEQDSFGPPRDNSDEAGSGAK